MEFRKTYRDLEMRVFRTLRDLVGNSTIKSKHCGEKIIALQNYTYSELAILNGRLTFLDSNGCHYSVYTVSLEDLIDIIEKVK